MGAGNGGSALGRGEPSGPNWSGSWRVKPIRTELGLAEQSRAEHGQADTALDISRTTPQNQVSAPVTAISLHMKSTSLVSDALAYKSNTQTQPDLALVGELDISEH